MYPLLLSTVGLLQLIQYSTLIFKLCQIFILDNLGDYTPITQSRKSMILYMKRYSPRKIIAISKQEGWGQTAVRNLSESNNRSTANER